MKSDLAEIKTALQDRVGDLCRRLLPRGRDEGGFWVAHNPHEDGRRHNPALKVRLRGGVAGAWKDWRSGDKGDVLGLVAFCLQTDVAGALTWSRDFLGLAKMSRADREQMRRVSVERREQQEKDDAARRAKKLLDADRLFRAGGGNRPIGPCLVPLGTFSYTRDAGAIHPAQRHAEAYFAARKVPLAEIAQLNALSLRFSPQSEWWRGARYESEDGRRIKTADGPLFPAVHSAMRNALGIVTCCHVTFLDPARPAKAPVEQAKLMYGEALGAVIEISTGPSGKPFWQWAEGDAAHPVILTEGIETGMSFAVAGIPARVWACGSLAGIGAAPVELPCISWVMFARDNNTGNRQAQQQFAGALAGLETKDKHIEVVASHVGDDFNDLAKGEE